MCKKFPKKRFLVSNENLKYLCPETEKDSDPWNMVPDIENIDDRSRGLRDCMIIYHLGVSKQLYRFINRMYNVFI